MRPSLVDWFFVCTVLFGCSEAEEGSQNANPAEQPTATGSMLANCTPDFSCEPEQINTGDFHADCVSRVNQFRACVCLPPLARKRDAESCLNDQAEYDAERGAHAGFRDGTCSPQASAQNECPGWGSAQQVLDGCLQAMFDEGPPDSEPCEGACYQEHGHYINMTQTRYDEVACGLFAAGDEVWSVQNFY